MHSAPAVRYPVPRSAHAGRALFALCVLPVLPCACLVAYGTSVHAVLVVCAAWALAAGACVWQWRRMPAGELCWDGQQWWWVDGRVAGRPELAVAVAPCLDLQSAMLVRIQGGAVTTWACLERAVAAARWQDLRRALHRRASAVAASSLVQP